jgi:hypothetical protein
MVVLTSLWPISSWGDGADVVAVFETVGGEGVTRGVRCRGLVDPDGDGGLTDGPLDDGFMYVVTANLLGLRVGVCAGGGEDPLPDPLAGGAGVLAPQGVR